MLQEESPSVVVCKVNDCRLPFSRGSKDPKTMTSSNMKCNLKSKHFDAYEEFEEKYALLKLRNWPLLEKDDLAGDVHNPTNKAQKLEFLQ